MTRVSILIAHGRNEGYFERLKVSLGHLDADTELLVSSEGNKSECRNDLARRAKGDVLVFFDDDVAVRKNTLAELTELFRDPRVGIVGGVNIAFPLIHWREQVGATMLASPFTMFRSSARYTPRGDIRVSDEAEILSCVMAVRKTAFFAAGGFPTDIIPCEENVLINKVQKLGYIIIYNPFAVVYHNRRRVFLPYWKEIFNYGRGRGIMMREGKGSPKMLWRPNRKWLYYAITFVGHYISYILGVAYGFLRGKKCSEKAKAIKWDSHKVSEHCSRCDVDECEEPCWKD